MSWLLIAELCYLAKSMHGLRLLLRSDTQQETCFTPGGKKMLKLKSYFLTSLYFLSDIFNKTGFSGLTSCFELYCPTSGSNSGFNPTARAESQPLLLLHGQWSGLGSAHWKAAKENQHAINKSVFTLAQTAVWRSIVRMTFLESSLLSAVMQQDYHPGPHLKCLSHTCQTRPVQTPSLDLIQGWILLFVTLWY